MENLVKATQSLCSVLSVDRERKPQGFRYNLACHCLLITTGRLLNVLNLQKERHSGADLLTHLCATLRRF